MVGRYQAYPEYKDSGVEWFCNIPLQWKRSRLKFLASINMGQSPSSDDCNKDGLGLPFLQGNAEFGAKSPIAINYCEIPRKLAKAGDLLFSVRAPVGALNIADQVYGIGRGLCSIQSSTELSSNYLWWLVSVLKTELNSVSTGSTFEAVSTEQVSNVEIFMPCSLSEQQQIANFLDHEAAKIDTLIEKQQQLIALLKEKRQAVINHAVTKGLNPDVPMKDSGIEWPEKVPVHWDVVMLGKKIQLQRGVDITKDQQSPGKVPVVSSGGISSYHNKATCTGPGVVVGRKGTAGKLHYIDSDYWAHDTTLYVKEFRGHHVRYVYYSLKSMGLETYDTGSANPTLNRNIVHPVKVSWCPVKEQQDIVKYLDQFCLLADEITEKANCAIKLLQERRTALISAAVTGKIDVRNWQPPTTPQNSQETP